MEPRPAELTQAPEAATDLGAAIRTLRALCGVRLQAGQKRSSERGSAPVTIGGGESDLCSIQRPHHRIRDKKGKLSRASTAANATRHFCDWRRRMQRMALRRRPRSTPSTRRFSRRSATSMRCEAYPNPKAIRLTQATVPGAINRTRARRPVVGHRNHGRNPPKCGALVQMAMVCFLTTPSIAAVTIKWRLT